MRLGILVLVFTSLTLSGVAVAQPGHGGKEFDMERAQKRFEHSKEKREKVLEKVREVREEKIRKAFDLDDKRATALFGVLNEFDEARFAAKDKKRAAMMELRSEMQKDSPDERTVEGALDTIQATEEELMGARATKMKELKKLLDPVERAKFLVAERRFERQVRRTIHARHREGREGKRMRRRQRHRREDRRDRDF
jgi:hypothetical protein